jgi:PAS domain S-box-containing protein
MELAKPPLPAEVPEGAVKGELQQIVSGSLASVCAALAILYAIFTGAQLLVHSPQAILLAKFSAGITFLCTATWLVTRNVRVPGRWAHPIASFLAGLVLVAELLQIYVTQDALLTSHLILLILGVGSLFLALDWFLILAGSAVTSWSALAFLIFDSHVWIHFGLALGLATSLAFVIQVVRLRSITRLEKLKLQNQDHQKMLMEAIHAARVAEQRFRILSEASGEGVLLHVDGKITDANLAATHLFGYEAGELIGKKLTDLVSPVYHHVLDCATGSTERAAYVYGMRNNRSLFPIRLVSNSAVVQNREIIVTRVRNAPAEKVEEEVTRESDPSRNRIRR